MTVDWFNSDCKTVWEKKSSFFPLLALLVAQSRRVGAIHTQQSRLHNYLVYAKRGRAKPSYNKRYQLASSCPQTVCEA